MAVNVHVLKQILLEDHRFKSQFETYKSGAFCSPSSRSIKEHIMFGFEDDILHDKEKRPIYGYFSDGENGEMNSEEKYHLQIMLLAMVLLVLKSRKKLL